MNQEKLKTYLDQGGEIPEEELGIVCSFAWDLLRDEQYQGKALTLLCRGAKKEVVKKELRGKAKEDGVLEELLFSQTPKIRKNTARLIGMLLLEELDGVLSDALLKEDVRMVRPSMILALGALGTPLAKDALSHYTVEEPRDESEKKHYDEEQAALRTSLVKLTPVIRHTFVGLDEPREVLLMTPAGLSGVTEQELRSLGFEPLSVKCDSVTVKTKEYDRLFGVRSFTEALIPLSSGLPARPEALKSSGERFVGLLRQCLIGAEEYRYRIELRGDVKDRAGFINSCVQVLQNESLVNAPSGYEAELRIVVSKNTMNVFCKLYAYKDQRFDYREKSVSASIHPATAAAVLRFAKPYLNENARVLDPFCGSGTLLLEREKLMPVAALTGVDISHNAVEIARNNAKKAGSRAKFIVNDCLRFVANKPYDEVISNLPFGNRVSNHKNNLALYEGFVSRLCQWLKADGTAVLYTMEYRLLESLVKKNRELKIIHKTRTEAGGLLPYVFIIKRI